MENKAGFYWFTSASNGNNAVCGLYLITEPDQLIKITFHSFTIDCDNNGRLAVSSKYQTSLIKIWNGDYLFGIISR